MNEKPVNPHAQALGKMAKGVPKGPYTEEEKARRRQWLEKARAMKAKIRESLAQAPTTTEPEIK